MFINQKWFIKRVIIGYLLDIKYAYTPNEIILIISQFYPEFYFNFVDSKFIHKYSSNNSKECRYLAIHGKAAYMQDKQNKWLRFKYGNASELVSLNDIHGLKGVSIKGISESLVDTTIFVVGSGDTIYKLDDTYPSSRAIIMKSSFDSHVKQMVCGNGYGLFLSSNGNVYGYGRNYYNQLTNKHDNDLDQIQIIMNTSDIIQIGCCASTSVVLTNKYVLKIFGMNLEESILQSYPCMKEFKDVIQFNCGGNHIGYINSNYQLYMYGWNDFSQCGFTTDIEYLDVTELNINSKIISIKCGFDHSICETIHNEYYSFGCNKRKELLLNNDDNSCLPSLISMKYIQNNIIKSDNKIIDFIPGKETTYILLNN